MFMLQILFFNFWCVKIDEMVIVQCLRVDQQIFVVVVEILFCRVFYEGGFSDRIYVVFDDYRDEFIKNVEWENRGEG